MKRNEPPAKQWRILRAEGGAIYYATKEDRDRAAQEWADRDGLYVLTELWDAEHPQDYLNRGWGCDGTVRPRRGMRRHDYLLKAAWEMGVPLLMAAEAVATTELAHPPGWADVDVDPETGEELPK